LKSLNKYRVFPPEDTKSRSLGYNWNTPCHQKCSELSLRRSGYLIKRNDEETVLCKYFTRNRYN